VPSIVVASTAEAAPELSVGGVLRRAAGLAPQRAALVGVEADATRRWSFTELVAVADQLAAGLLEAFAPGERVAVCSPNTAEIVLLQYALAVAGLILVPLNPTLRDGELEYALRDCEAAGAFVAVEHRGRELASIVESLRPGLPALRRVVELPDGLGEWYRPAGEIAEPDPGSVVQIQYTSGTTGPPKGVLITHRGMATTASAFSQRTARPPGSVWVNPMPLFHTAGNVLGTLGACWDAATHVVLPFDAPRVLRALVDERADVLSAAPTLLHGLLDASGGPLELPDLEVIVTGGSTLEPAFVRRVEAGFAADLLVIYGMTETCGAALMTSPVDAPADRETTVGKPLPHTDIKVIDADSGDVAAFGQPGELCVRGARITAGYHGRPDETRRAIDADGWLHTGDRASMDERGYCRIEGRLKDLIKTGGENVTPSEVEACLAEHDAVARAAVVGLPDERWGELVTAFVIPAGERHSALAADLRAHCERHLAPFKVPRRWAFVDELPLTASSKVQHARLRERAIAEAELLEAT